MENLMLVSTGPEVKLIQSLLNRIGYNAGPVDGYYGTQTRNAVILFQSNNGLMHDGIVGPITWSAFEKYLLGVDRYVVRPGDTFYNLARRYYTTVSSIAAANPNVSPANLKPGQNLIIPYGIDIVFTDIDYTFEIMERNIKGLQLRYPFLEVGTIGTSVMGKNLYYIRIGRGSNELSYNASHHANEWITSPMAMKFIENFAKAYSYGGTLQGYDTVQIFNRSSIYIIPMVNPDGVNMVTYWPNYPSPQYDTAARLNTTGLPLLDVWKANIRGVDLNLNYPAEWDKEKQLELEQGITGPAPRDYGGEAPLSEPETSAMYNFTRQHSFRLVIAYHTQGGVIYYQFENYAPPESLTIANLFARASGYTVSTGTSEAAYAGYKDWFLQDFRRPGYTIEVGSGTNPLPVSQLPSIYSRNEEIMLLAPLL